MRGSSPDPRSAGAGRCMQMRAEVELIAPAVWRVAIGARREPTAVGRPVVDFVGLGNRQLDGAEPSALNRHVSWRMPSSEGFDSHFAAMSCLPSGRPGCDAAEVEQSALLAVAIRTERPDSHVVNVLAVRNLPSPGSGPAFDRRATRGPCPRSR